MTKEQILALTGLSEDQFYNIYPDQETFCADYPDACAQLQQAKQGGGIHINPANKGKFTASANRAGMGVQEFASHVLANKEDYSATQVKRANFARNASKWKHEDGGEFEQYQKGGYVVKSGDNLSAIAAANKMSLPELLSMNPQFRENPNLIHVGDKVMVGTPMQRSNREYGDIADAAMNKYRMMQYQVTPADARSVNNSYRNTAMIPTKAPASVKKETPKKLPNKQKEPSLFDNILQKVSQASDFASKLYDYGETFITDPTFRERVIGKWEEESPESMLKVNLPKTQPVLEQPIPFGYNQLGVVRDVKGVQPKDSLVSYSYTGDNEVGMPFVIGHMMANKTKDTFQNVRGVGHFLMDADVLPGQRNTQPYRADGNEYVKSSVPGKFINFSTNDPENFNMFYKPTGNRPDEYYVAYTQNKNRKKYLDQGYEGDLSLRNVRYSDVDWEGEGPSTGYAAKSKWLPTKNKNKPTSIPYKDKNAFSRFSGGSGIYVFKDPRTGKEIQSNVSGSVNVIRDWGKNIIDKYKIKPEDLQLLYHDMGSYSAKPKAYNGDVLSYYQWQNFNNYNKGRSGAPLIIPKEKGGDVFPAMRTMFRTGGYYGYDGKWRSNKEGANTYVPGGGYYFDPGGTVTDENAPGTPSGSMQAPQDQQSSFAYSNPYSDADQFSTEGQGYGEENYQGDPNRKAGFSQFNYDSKIDPSTGFKTYSKKGENTPYTNIKKQDEELWNFLKDKGHGARWETGQTDIQRFGRRAGMVGSTLGYAGDVADMTGSFIANRKMQASMNTAAMNMGSTANIYNNPQAASKGDYGVSGSGYGAFRPYKSSNMSYKGMYGKYGMEVPKYAVGGFIPDLPTQDIDPSSSLYDINKLYSYSEPVMSNIRVPSDNTRVDMNRIPNSDIPDNTIDVDLALQAVAGLESGSQPGQTKTGMRTKLVGKGGKRGTASGTFQITNQTLQEIYNKNNNIKSQFESFDKFKNAFDKDPNVEYEAARWLMSNHIKNYGVYALGAWYQPTFAKRAMSGDKSVYNIIPSKDEYGNKKTWGQDFQEKLNAYNKLAGTRYNVSSAISTKSPNVNIKNLHPNLMQFTNAMSQNFPGIVLSSGNDSVHMKGSKHYNNKAIDIGANSSDKKSYMALKKFLMSNPSVKKQYGIENIIDEGDHLHVELMKTGGQMGGQVVEMDEDQIQQFLAAGGQLEFLD